MLQTGELKISPPINGETSQRARMPADMGSEDPISISENYRDKMSNKNKPQIHLLSVHIISMMLFCVE